MMMSCTLNNFVLSTLAPNRHLIPLIQPANLKPGKVHAELEQRPKERRDKSDCNKIDDIEINHAIAFLFVQPG